MKELSIIVPTYNERDNIHILYNEINEVLSSVDYELIFVDDSDDQTPEEIEKICYEDSRVRLIHRDDEKGLATAVIKGFEASEGEYVSVMDADLQHPPVLQSRMLNAIKSGYDICIPSRFIAGGNDGGLNIYRKFISWTARKLGQITLKSLRPMSDVTSGVFMIRKNCIEGADLRPVGWKILVEVLAMAEYSRVCEIPYAFDERYSGESKISIGVTLDYLKQLRILKKREKKNRKVSVTILDN